MFAVCALGCVASSVFAQSSVTVYGVVDINYQYLSSGKNSPLQGNNLQRLEDGHKYGGPGSRLGFRALEDLGDGLTAGAVLEMGIVADTGGLAQGGRGFGRQSFVNLSSPTWGEVRLGRQYALHDETMNLTEPFGNTTLLSPGAVNTFAVGVVPMFIDAPRIDNMAQYLTPPFAGFRLQAAVAAGEGLVDRYQGLKGTYSEGKLNVAASYEWSKARAATAGVSSAGDTVNKVLELGANYDFGPFKAFGGYQQGRSLTPGPSGIVTAPAATGGVGTQIASLTLPGLRGPATDLTAYTAGASVDFGLTSVGVNYTRTQYEDRSGADQRLRRVGALALYRFSKRTLVYGGVGVHNGDLKDYINEKRIVQLGLRHSF